MSAEVRPPETSAGRSRFSPQAILILVGLTVVALFGLSAFLPRWWSHRIGDQVHGSFSSGIGLGLFYGFVLTLIPLAIALVCAGSDEQLEAAVHRSWSCGTCCRAELAHPLHRARGRECSARRRAHSGCRGARIPDEQPYRRRRGRARDRDARSRLSLPPSVARGGGGTEGPAGDSRARCLSTARSARGGA